MEHTTSSTARRCGSPTVLKPRSSFSSQKTSIIQTTVSRSTVVQPHSSLIPPLRASLWQKEDKLGIRSSDTCTLVLKDCKVPVENIIKGAGNGFPIAMNALDNSRSVLQHRHWVSLREPTKHRSSMHTSVKRWKTDCASSDDHGLSRRHGDSNRCSTTLVYKASWAKQQHYEHDGPRHTKEASMAKLYAGDTAMWVSERAIQVHGGYGYTKEFPVERFFRDAKITQIYEGTQEVQRIVVARSLL